MRGFLVGGTDITFAMFGAVLIEKLFERGLQAINGLLLTGYDLIEFGDKDLLVRQLGLNIDQTFFIHRTMV